MDSHCVYQIATYVLAHGQIRLLSGDAFGLRALKYLQIANPPQNERNLLLKGMGDDALVGLLHVTPEKTPITHKDNRDNPFGPCPRAHRPLSRR